MSRKLRLLVFVPAAAFAALVLLAGSPALGQVAGLAERNMSKMANYQNECAVIKNPTNKLALFAMCNNATGGLFAARSTDGGGTWVYPDPSKTIANGINPALGPAACCDPTLAWDAFGNLFITYIDSGVTNIVTLLSTDGGQTFTNLVTFGPASVDQPTVTADSGAVWIVWNQAGQMVARGAAVTGLGAVGAFIPLQTIPGTAGCSFGDIAIAPSGAVVQVCESPSGGSGPASLLVNIKADGLGPNPFGPAITATATNVGGFHFIPPQNVRSVDAEAGFAFDRNPASPHFGRLYLVYTDEPAFPDTDIMLRFSDDNGTIWSNPPIRVNDDAPGNGKSQFLPRIASNRLSGNIAVCWHDCRNSPGDNTMQEFCTIATPTGASPAFMANAQISAGTSTGTGSSPPVAGQADIQFGDYSGLTYFQGLAHPAWADDSNSTGDNPDGAVRYDAYTNRVTGGPAANEGDPHLSTVDGIHYDFQSAGEFVSLRDYDGLEIQTRQTPVATATTVGPNPHTGLTTCVSLNSAVAARVNGRRVTYEPNLSGVPDPSGLQLRVDGALTTLAPNGLDLGSGGRVVQSSAGAIEIDFPDETVLIVTPLYWASQGKWYLNVDVFHTPATEGILGAMARGSWLPALANGVSLGPLPASLHQRYLALYQTFADAWRVTDQTSLFDYAPGTSTATFTLPSWPQENPPCVIPQNPVARPADPHLAQRLCRAVVGKNRKANCVFDVTVTGEPGFAKLYLLSQRIETGSTTTTVSDDVDPSQVGEWVTFTAIVARNEPRGGGAPTGTVQFYLDGSKVGEPVRLDSQGRATWETSRLKVGRHLVAAGYMPGEHSVFLASSSLEKPHTVRRCYCESGAGGKEPR
jgi:Bacterial Ig-like domain (group 3)